LGRISEVVVLVPLQLVAEQHDAFVLWIETDVEVTRGHRIDEQLVPDPD
jgi:hypothetical protein